jgi:hypothetical protein
MGIIDLLFHNFYVPPIILAVMQDEGGDEICICVDGRQHLTSIVRFLSGSVRSSNFFAAQTLKGD